jgi:isopenicillin-N N-acyltransferase like protein
VPPIRTLSVSGDPYRMGYQHGRAYAKAIGDLTEERLKLCATDDWARAGVHRHVIIDLAERCMPHHRRFDEALCVELEGIADGAGVPIAELLVMNGFTDFVDVLHQHVVDDPGGCTAVMTAPGESPDGHGYLAQTWDMHTTATPYVLMLDLRPDTGPAALTFTLNGCVGMIGINDAGVAVGINNLYTSDGSNGVTWPFVVRKMLAQTDVNAAMAVLETADLAGAHNYLVMGPDGQGESRGDIRGSFRGDIRGYNVEAGPSLRSVTPLETTIVHTNHCLEPALASLERPRSDPAEKSTVTRLDQARAFLDNHRGKIDVDTLIELTRLRQGEGFSVCQKPVEGYDVESSGACVMSPATREMWAVWGLPCDNDYQHFTPGGSCADTVDT